MTDHTEARRASGFYSLLSTSLSASVTSLSSYCPPLPAQLASSTSVVNLAASAANAPLDAIQSLRRNLEPRIAYNSPNLGWSGKRSLQTSNSSASLRSSRGSTLRQEYQPDPCAIPIPGSLSKSTSLLKSPTFASELDQAFERPRSVRQKTSSLSHSLRSLDPPFQEAPLKRSPTKKRRPPLIVLSRIQTQDLGRSRSPLSYDTRSRAGRHSPLLQSMSFGSRYASPLHSPDLSDLSSGPPTPPLSDCGPFSPASSFDFPFRIDDDRQPVLLAPLSATRPPSELYQKKRKEKERRDSLDVGLPSSPSSAWLHWLNPVNETTVDPVFAQEEEEKKGWMSDDEEEEQFAVCLPFLARFRKR